MSIYIYTREYTRIHCTVRNTHTLVLPRLSVLHSLDHVTSLTHVMTS